LYPPEVQSTALRLHVRPFLVGLTIVLGAMALYQLVELASTPWGRGLIAADVVKGYLPGARRFLDTGSPYLPEQVGSPWAIEVHSFIHPPAALPLFLAFLILPLPLWWVLPMSGTAAAVWRLRPSPWTWPVMAACLVWPRSTGAILAGNSDLWAMAAVAAGAVWGWPAVLLAIKPTFAPLGILALRRKSAWGAAGILGITMLPLAPLWFDWLAVIWNSGLGLGYSVPNLPLVMIGAVAFLGRRRPLEDGGVV
jgi:hypothetical protein